MARSKKTTNKNEVTVNNPAQVLPAPAVEDATTTKGSKVKPVASDDVEMDTSKTAIFAALRSWLKIDNDTAMANSRAGELIAAGVAPLDAVKQATKECRGRGSETCSVSQFVEELRKYPNFGDILPLITIDKKIMKYFKTRNFQLDKIESIDKIPIPIFKSKEDYTKFTSYVMDLPQQLYDDHKEKLKGILIFIDEFQMLKQLEEDVNGFLWYIRSVIQSQKHIGYIFSGSMSVKDELISDIAGQNGAFGGRILNYEIKIFSYETTKQYLTEKADYLNFTTDGFERFYKCTNGIPYYINSFARLLPPNEELNEEKIISEFKKSLEYLLIKLTNEWYKLNKQEQRIITTLVEKPLRRIEIANKLGVTSGAIGASLKTLQNKILIEMDNDKYKIYDPIFKAWLKKEYEEKGDYPY